MSRRPFGPADDDAPWGDDAPVPGAEEPTLRELVTGALFDAGFRVCRDDWPIDRGAFLNEVAVSEARDADGYEVCVIGWPGPSKGSAVERHQGAFEAARAALVRVGLYAHHEGGLRLEVGWQGTPEGEWARMMARRGEGVAAA